MNFEPKTRKSQSQKAYTNKEKDPKCQKRKKRKETQNFTVQEIGMELYKQST